MFNNVVSDMYYIYIYFVSIVWNKWYGHFVNNFLSLFFIG